MRSASLMHASAYGMARSAASVISAPSVAWTCRRARAAQPSKAGAWGNSGVSGV